jgi:hypothetical protein
MITITQGVVDKINELLDHGLPAGLGEAKPGKMCVEAAISYALGLKHSDDPGCVIEPLRQLKIRLNDTARWTSNKARAEGLRRLAIAQLGSKGTVDPIDFVKRVATMTIRTVVPSALRSVAKVCLGEHPAKLLAWALKCEQEPTEANAREAQKTAAYAASAASASATYAAAYASASDASAAAASADAAAYAAAAVSAAASAAYAASATYAAAYASASDASAASAASADAAAYAAYAAASDAAAERVLIDYAEEVVQILIEMKAPGCAWLVTV